MDDGGNLAPDLGRRGINCLGPVMTWEASHWTLDNAGFHAPDLGRHGFPRRTAGRPRPGPLTTGNKSSRTFDDGGGLTPGPRTIRETFPSTSDHQGETLFRTLDNADCLVPDLGRRGSSRPGPRTERRGRSCPGPRLGRRGMPRPEPRATGNAAPRILDDGK